MATADETQSTPTGRVIEIQVTQRLDFRQEARSLIRLPEEEQVRRMEMAQQTIDAMRAIENGPGEDDREFLRLLDESRPGGMGLRSFYSDVPDPA